MAGNVVIQVERDFLSASAFFAFIRECLFPVYSRGPYSWDMSENTLRGVASVEGRDCVVRAVLLRTCAVLPCAACGC